MATDTLTWLQQWYESRCDGEWEHGKGVRIETLDNPGWLIEMDVGEIAPFDPICLERSESDWIRCELQVDRLVGHCGPSNLDEVLEAIRARLEAPGS